MRRKRLVCVALAICGLCPSACGGDDGAPGGDADAVDAWPEDGADRDDAAEDAPPTDVDARDGESLPDPCGNGVCEDDESCASCPADCGGGCLTVWVADSLTRVQPLDPPGSTAAAEIMAARNEYEAFHVVVAAPAGAALSQVDASVSDLVGPGAIAAADIRLYREHYVTITNPTYLSPLPAGAWPDAMVPFLHPETGEPLPGGRFEAAPFSVPAGTNQPIYVEVFVPEGTAPGVYTGRVTLTADGFGATRVPVMLTVRDVTLPDRPTLESNFGSMRDVTNVALYKDMMLAHRIAPSYVDGAAPSCTSDGSVDVSTAAPILADAIGRGLASAMLPFWEDWPYADPRGADRDAAVLCLRNLQAFFRDAGFSDRAHLYVVDEPNDADRYQAVRDFFAMAREADPETRLLVTEQPWTQDASWGTLNGSVDIWVPLFQFLDDPRIAAALAAGDEVWSYTALVQGDVALPHWEIDFPLVNYRATPWLNALGGLTGILYWTTAYWSSTGTDVWVDPDTYQEETTWAGTLHYNGEGSLFYPGDAVGYDGPVASLRLKALRDGMEDFEYVQLLREAGRTTEASTILGEVARSWTDFAVDQADYDGARAEAAEILEGL